MEIKEINIGFYDGFRVCPGKNTKRNIALERHKKPLWLIWKSNVISFKKAIEELKNNFKVVDKVINDKLVKTFNKCEYKPKKVQTQLTKLIVFDLEIFNTDRMLSLCNLYIYGLRASSGRSNRDITQRQYEKCRKYCIVFEGRHSINEMLDHVIQFKGEAKKDYNKIIKFNLYTSALDGASFDISVV